MTRFGVVLLLAFAAAGLANQPPVRRAWVKQFPDLYITAVMPDHLGHIALVGVKTSNVVVLLLNEHGRILAQRTAPMPAATAVTFDKSDIIYLSTVAPNRDDPTVYA